MTWEPAGNAPYPDAQGRAHIPSTHLESAAQWDSNCLECLVLKPNSTLESPGDSGKTPTSPSSLSAVTSGIDKGTTMGSTCLGHQLLTRKGTWQSLLRGWFFHVMQLPSRYTLDGPQYLPLRTAKRSCSWENRAVTQSRTWA